MTHISFVVILISSDGRIRGAITDGFSLTTVQAFTEVKEVHLPQDEKDGPQIHSKMMKSNVRRRNAALWTGTERERIDTESGMNASSHRAIQRKNWF